MFARLHGNNLSSAPDARVHDCKKDGSTREKRACGPQKIAGLEDLVRLNVMREVDNASIRVDGEDDALHRSDIGVFKSEIR